MEHLLNENDICCIQEHWLFQFQLPHLNKLHKNFQAHAKAVDERDPIPPIQVPRGYGGNGILYRTNWNVKTALPTDGCERIVVMELDTLPSICIISVYLPCRGNTSKALFDTVLQELDELMEKYTTECAVLLCGDFNASLTRHPPNDRDIALRDFVSRQNLQCQQTGSPTFFHASGNSSAEIDYILKNPTAAKMSSPVLCVGPHPDNVSDHVAVSTEVYVCTDRIQNATMSVPRPNWEKCNKADYKRTLNEALAASINTMDLQIEESVAALKEIVDRATQASIPGFCPNKPKKKKGYHKPYGQHIRDASKRSKEAWWQWKLEGAPVDHNHPTKNAMKEAKRDLRKAQRVERALQRRRELEEIMQAKDSSAMFHRLIRKQRTTTNTGTNCLVVNGISLTTPEDIMKGWASHFETLATQKTDPRYDDSYLLQTECDIETIDSIIHAKGEDITPANEEEVQSAIAKLNNNKAPDYLGFTAEHLKLGGEALHRYIAKLVNTIFKNKEVPPLLKQGTITPVFKKGDAKVPDNYRGITVTSILLKTLEHILNTRHKDIFQQTQSRLQTGFTKGTSSARSALLVTECQLEAKAAKKQLIFVTLDTRKAFDVVNHKILLRNLFLDGVPEAEWNLLRDLYKDMQACVKWLGQKSEIFKIDQGVRQGGVLSTEHYKRFNNPLLLQLENNFQGATIGNVKIPHATCADDLALLSHYDWEMRLMLSTVESYSRTHRYDINPTKSACIVQQNADKHKDKDLELEGQNIPITNQTTHLGVYRNSTGKLNVDEKINLGRRTAYSLLGAGLHGNTGLDQRAKAHIWTTYVTPRILFGIEVTPYKDTDLKKLDSYQTKTTKQIQHLPDRTSNVAAVALLGISPLIALVHKATINTFYNVIQSAESVECRVAERQLAVKKLEDNSFFSRARRLLLHYSLPTAYDLLEDTPDKESWKKLLSDAVNDRVEEKWRAEILEKPTLKFINPDAVHVGTVHHMYSTVRPNQADVKRAEIKARLLTGTYTLQANRAVFNQYSVDPTCKICKDGPETREHFIASCTTLEDTRSKYRTNLQHILTRFPEQEVKDMLLDPLSFTQLVLDCTHDRMPYSKHLSPDEVEHIEILSRELLSRLHLQRCRELAGQST